MPRARGLHFLKGACPAPVKLQTWRADPIGLEHKERRHEAPEIRKMIGRRVVPPGERLEIEREAAIAGIPDGLEDREIEAARLERELC
jgi:hypothetical protein